MPAPLINIEHSTILHAAKLMGYSIDMEGMCKGIAYMGMQALLADELPQFDERVMKINVLLSKMNVDSAEILTLSRDEKVDLLAFFDGVVLYQHPKQYSDFFSKKIYGQDSNAALPLLLSKKLEEKGGIRPYDALLNSFNEQELKRLLNDMKARVFSLNDSAKALIVEGAHHNARGYHAICIGYDPKKNNWYAIDANELPSVEFKDDSEVVDYVMSVYRGHHRRYCSLKITPFGLVTEKNKNDEVINLSNSFRLIFDREMQTIDKSKIQRKDAMGNKLMFLANLLEDDIELVRIMLEKGSDANELDKSRVPMLISAILKNNEEKISLLIHHGANPNVADENNFSALLIAANSASDSIVKMLVEAGADINKKVKIKSKGKSVLLTPLFVAISRGDEKIVKILLNAGAIPNDVMVTANLLDVAIDSKKMEICKFLIEAGADIDSSLLVKKNLTEEYRQELIDISELHSKSLISEIKQYIEAFQWKTSSFGGNEISINDRVIRVPAHVKKQWNEILLAESGKISYRAAAQKVIKIAQTVPIAITRQESPRDRDYYDSFRAGNFHVIRKKLNEQYNLPFFSFFDKNKRSMLDKHNFSDKHELSELLGLLGKFSLAIEHKENRKEFLDQEVVCRNQLRNDLFNLAALLMKEKSPFTKSIREELTALKQTTQFATDLILNVQPTQQQIDSFKKAAEQLVNVREVLKIPEKRKKMWSSIMVGVGVLVTITSIAASLALAPVFLPAAVAVLVGGVAAGAALISAGKRISLPSSELKAHDNVSSVYQSVNRLWKKPTSSTDEAPEGKKQSPR